MDMRRLAHERVGRETRFEAVYAFQLETEARARLRNLFDILDPQDRTNSSVLSLTQNRPTRRFTGSLPPTACPSRSENHPPQETTANTQHAPSDVQDLNSPTDRVCDLTNVGWVRGDHGVTPPEGALHDSHINNVVMGTLAR